MELKYHRPTTAHARLSCSNRTFMELKPGVVMLTDDADSSNRTFMELK